MDYIQDLRELCDTLSGELADINEKIRSAGGKMSAGDLEIVDKLTHSIKSIKSTIAMMEDEDGYSGYYPIGSSYNRGHGGSYARGRGMRGRDSMGRYSGERGHSRNDLADRMRDMMEDADERTRQELSRIIDKMEKA